MPKFIHDKGYSYKGSRTNLTETTTIPATTEAGPRTAVRTTTVILAGVSTIPTRVGVSTIIAEGGLLRMLRV
jgi:hypothetical protein